SGASITATAGGVLSAGTVKADTELLLSGGTGLTGRTLTSSKSRIGLASLTGSVTVTGATAKTAFSAYSGQTLDVRGFTVTGGGAVLQSGAGTVLGTGKTTGDIDVTSTGHAALGTLTTGSSGKISATSTRGGLTFGTLRAGTGITLDANTSWSGGNAISGSALYVSSGLVDLLAEFGNISVGTLSVAKPVGISKLTTRAGSLKVSQISGLTPSQLQVGVAGGTRTLPKGF
ncbi:MAG: hypothetical protein JWR60_2133, partial [Polaromonas sp.]|nr:hypothetical protein [Polaromonas sp.]